MIIKQKVLAKMSSEEYLKMSLIIFFYSSVSFFYFSVKSKKANLIRLILFQKLANKIFPPKR